MSHSDIERYRFVGACVIPHTHKKKEGFVVVQTAKDRRYGLPGGKIDLFEDPNRTTIREVGEETNLEIMLDGVVGLYPFESGHDNYIISIMYAGRVVEGNLGERKKEEIIERRVATLSELRDFYHHGKLRSLVNLVAVEDYLSRGYQDLSIISPILRG